MDECSNGPGSDVCAQPLAQAEPVPAANYKVPQCSAHGLFAEKGTAPLVANVRSKKRESEIVMVQYAVAIDEEEGKERCVGARRRGPKKCVHAGEYRAGRDHTVDVVLAQKLAEPHAVRVIAGWEVSGEEHGRVPDAKEDERKMKNAGFHIEHVTTDAQLSVIDDAVVDALHEAKYYM